MAIYLDFKLRLFITEQIILKETQMPSTEKELNLLRDVSQGENGDGCNQFTF